MHRRPLGLIAQTVKLHRASLSPAITPVSRISGANSGSKVILMNPAGTAGGLPNCNRCYASQPDLKVQHDVEMRMFYVELEDVKALITYKIDGDIFTVLHTNVPEKFRGRRMGYVLAKEVLEYATDKGYKLQIECSLVDKYISDYAPQYAQHLAH